ncbi:hypothetical protein HHI36_005588 [Cryptolaemus montrouzieri]|uniref:Uncharacterized protein n=1 Tax=Cryptolaemus montrouzieri TaxID=559131 RepID=A0ABD2NUN5_9CUCU
MSSRIKRCPRIYLGEGSDNYNTIVASPNRKEINRQLCLQCRHAELCRIHGDCKLCSQYCKTYETDEKRDIESSPEEVAITRESEKDNAREEGKDQIRENVQIMDIEPEEVTVKMAYEEPEEDMVQMVHQRVDENLEKTLADQTSREAEAEAKGKRKPKRRQESRYYPIGTINPSVSLNILLRLTELEHTDGVEKAVILVKSKTPVNVADDAIEIMGDSVFLKIFARELDNAEKKIGRSKLTIREMNKLIETAYEIAEEKTEPKTHLVGTQEDTTENSRTDTVGCSLEETENVPLYPHQQNLYRSGSLIQSEKPSHKNIETEQEEFGNTLENNERIHSKNPIVIQGDPNMQSRNSPAENADTPEMLSHPLKATEIIDEISNQLKHLENMNLVGATKTRPVGKEASGNEDQEVEEMEEQKENEETDSDGESEEYNEKSRTFKKKKKLMKNKNKGGGGNSYGYGYSYGHSNSYGHGAPYGMYRQADNDKDTGDLVFHDTSEKLVASSHSDVDEDKIHIPDSEITLDKKKFMAARPDLDSHDGLPEQFHEGIHAHFRKIQEANMKKLNKETVPLPEEPVDSRNAEDILGTKHKKQKKKKGGYYRESQDEIMKDHDKNDETMVSSGTSEIEELPNNGSPNTGVHFEPNDLINLQLPNLTPSKESMESQESSEQQNNSNQAINDNEFSHHLKGSTQMTNERPEDNKINMFHKTHAEHQPSSDSHANDVAMSHKEQTDESKQDEFHRSLPGQTVLQVDDQLVDVPKEGPTIFHKEIKNEDNTVGIETPLEPNESRNIANGFRLNPEVITDEPGFADVNDVPTIRPEFPFKKILPSKITAATVSSSAPAYGENRKVEIRIPNFVSAPMNQDMGNMEQSVTEPTVEMTEIPNTLNIQDQDVVGAKQNDNSLERLITPQEQEFLHNFGKIVPAAEKMHLNNNADVYFMGNGIKLPLKVSQNEDGSVGLAVDLEKLCKCKNATCIHKTEMLKHLEHNLVGIPAEMSSETKKSEAPGMTEHPHVPIPRKIRKVRNHKDYSNFHKTYNRKYHKLHKRSLNETSKKIKWINTNFESEKYDPNSDIKNSLVKESDQKEAINGNELQDIKDIQKFQQMEKELEKKLERLQKDVRKSSSQYDNMLQEGTKNLLQIKGEDEVVKHRIELVNDFLKWMKKIAEDAANFDADNENAK